MAVWPLLIPQRPTVDGFHVVVPSNIVRSDMETGPAKVRRRGNARPYRVKAAYVLDLVEKELLHSFVVDVLSGGSKCFDWPHPVECAYVLARVVPSSDGLYSEVPRGGSLWWTVELELEIFPDAPLTTPRPPDEPRDLVLSAPTLCGLGKAVIMESPNICSME